MVRSSSPIDEMEIEYPETDGQPIGGNTLEFEWITTSKFGIEILFHHREDVFVAGDLLWYPVRGDIKERAASDTFVVFGRQKEHRSSYIQHREAGIAPQVVFEVRSPSNDDAEMDLKLDFYDRHGLEEYYNYDPERGTLEGYRRPEAQGTLEPILEIRGWISPRLGIRFGIDEGELELFRPDGQAVEPVFDDYLDREAAHARALEATLQIKRVQLLAEAERARAETKKARAEAEQAKAEKERIRTTRLEALLREAGIDPNATSGFETGAD